VSTLIYRVMVGRILTLHDLRSQATSFPWKPVRLQSPLRVSQEKEPSRPAALKYPDPVSALISLRSRSSVTSPLEVSNPRFP